MVSVLVRRGNLLLFYTTATTPNFSLLLPPAASSNLSRAVYYKANQSNEKMKDPVLPQTKKKEKMKKILHCYLYY